MLLSGIPLRLRRGGIPVDGWDTFAFGNVSSPTDLAVHKELTQGYAAAVSFVDAQLGRLLDAVEELGLWNNLTVVATSDHGHSWERKVYGVASPSSTRALAFRLS